MSLFFYIWYLKQEVILRLLQKTRIEYFILFSKYLENSVPIWRLKPMWQETLCFLHFFPVTSVVVPTVWQNGRTIWGRNHVRRSRRFKHHLLLINIPRKWFRRKMSIPWSYTMSVWALTKPCKERKQFSRPWKSVIGTKEQ